MREAFRYSNFGQTSTIGILTVTSNGAKTFTKETDISAKYAVQGRIYRLITKKLGRITRNVGTM